MTFDKFLKEHEALIYHEEIQGAGELDKSCLFFMKNGSVKVGILAVPGTRSTWKFDHGWRADVRGDLTTTIRTLKQLKKALGV
jgi:hypothetical protein